MLAGPRTKGVCVAAGHNVWGILNAQATSEALSELIAVHCSEQRSDSLTPTRLLPEGDPGFSISAWIARGGQSNAKLQIEGLRKAGLPE